MNPDERDPRLTALYRRMAAENPPAALDARILAAAGRAVARRRWWQLPMRPVWGVPLASAAVVLLALSLVTFVALDRRGVEPAAGPSRSDAPAASTAAEMHGRDLDEGEVPEARRAEREDAPAEHRRKAAQALAPAPASATAGTEMGAPASSMPLAPARPVAKGEPAEPMGEGDGLLRPEPWLARISALVASGRRSEAAAELARFRRAYPDHPVPPALQSLLPAPRN